MTTQNNDKAPMDSETQLEVGGNFLGLVFHGRDVWWGILQGEMSVWELFVWQINDDAIIRWC